MALDSPPTAQSLMEKLTRSLTSLCLLAAVAAPLLYYGTQFAAAPFFPGFSFSRFSVSMLGTGYSRQPWIYNAGIILTGLALVAGACGLYLAFRRKTNVLLSGLVALAVAAAGVMTLKSGLFPLPDPRHNSWDMLFNLIILIPFLMLIGLMGRKNNPGLRGYLIGSIALMIVLIPLKERLGPGNLQRLIALTTLVPVGVLGFFLRRETQPLLPADSIDSFDSYPETHD